MTLLERKAEFIKQILTDPDESNFERLEQFYKNIGSAPLPCQKTVVEMKKEVQQAMVDYENGKKNYFTLDELKANSPICK